MESISSRQPIHYILGRPAVCVSIVDVPYERNEEAYKKLIEVSEEIHYPIDVIVKAGNVYDCYYICEERKPVREYITLDIKGLLYQEYIKGNILGIPKLKEFCRIPHLYNHIDKDNKYACKFDTPSEYMISLFESFDDMRYE